MTKQKKGEPAVLAQIFPNWEQKDRTYILKRQSTPVSFQLRSRNTTYRSLEWFDKEYGYSRPIRYVENQNYIFEDEQKDGAKLGSIVFEDGKLVVPKENVILQQFLALHPDNGTVFYEFDPEAKAQADLDKELKGFEAVAMALEMDISKLEAVARVIFPHRVDSMTSGEIKRDVVFYAKKNPEQFEKVANNSNIQMRNLASKAISLGVIKIADDNVTIKWGTNGKEITKLPFSADPMETLAAWMKTDEGLKMVEALASKIE